MIHRRPGAILIAALAVLPLAVSAQIEFTIEATETCLANAAPEDRVQCVGKAAAACMNATQDGGTTYGMSGCLSEEADYWDGRLNEFYGLVREANQKTDAEMKDIGSSAPEQAPALQQTQRAWIAYRDATCAYEASWWGGGTGAGPAANECFMRMTGQQALYLEDALNWGN